MNKMGSFDEWTKKLIPLGAVILHSENNPRCRLEMLSVTEDVPEELQGFKGWITSRIQTPVKTLVTEVHFTILQDRASKGFVLFSDCISEGSLIAKGRQEGFDLSFLLLDELGAFLGKSEEPFYIPVVEDILLQVNAVK